MRKDARMMDLATLVNRLLGRQAECRTRKLAMRTYAVLPLAEDR